MSIKLNYLRQILSRCLIHTHKTRGCDPCVSICVLRLSLGIISYNTCLLVILNILSIVSMCQCLFLHALWLGHFQFYFFSVYFY